MNPTTDAVYLISPLAHIVDCLMADFEKRKYRRSFLIWTAGLESVMFGEQWMLIASRTAISSQPAD
jgi:hypothetical protein